MVAYVPLPASKRRPMANSRPAGPIDPAEIKSVIVPVRSAENPEQLANDAYELGGKLVSKRKEYSGSSRASMPGLGK